MFTYTKKHLKLLFSSMLFGVAFLFLSCEPDKQDTPEPLAAAVEAKLGPNRPNSAYHNKTLAEARQGTVHYKNVEDAILANYEMASPCVSGPMGGMGYHFVNFMLIDDNVDPRQPEALVYEPQKNGKLQLVAVEYIVDAETWDANNDGPPMLGDQVFDDFRSLVNNPLRFPHYQLHVWIWKHNPAGMHTPYNPNVNCDYAN